MLEKLRKSKDCTASTNVFSMNSLHAANVLVNFLKTDL